MIKKTIKRKMEIRESVVTGNKEYEYDVYVAYDGDEFRHELDCLRHEAYLDKKKIGEELLKNVQQKNIVFYFDGEYSNWFLFNSHRELVEYLKHIGAIDKQDPQEYCATMDMNSLSFPQWIAIEERIAHSDDEYDNDEPYFDIVAFDEIKKDFEELNDLLFNTESYDKFIEQYRK
jgi:hypothetical protein